MFFNGTVTEYNTNVTALSSWVWRRQSRLRKSKDCSRLWDACKANMKMFYCVRNFTPLHYSDIERW